MSKKSRILSAVEFEGRSYQPNQVIEFDDKVAKSLEKDGQVDTNADAVAYCTDVLGVVSVVHESADSVAARADAAKEPEADPKAGA